MNDRYSLAAGLFILVSIALVMYVLIQISDTSMFNQKQEWTVRFPAGNDLQGLREDSPVRIFGIEVGNVEKIEIVPAADGEPAGVNVRFTLPEQYALKTGADITVQSGLTGGALLYIDDLGEGQPLDPSQTVMGEATSLAQVLASLGDALPTATETLGSVKTAVDNGNRLILKVTDKVDPLTDQVAGVLGKADESMTYVRDLLGESTPDLRQTIVDLRSFMANANSLVDGENNQDLDAIITNIKGFTETANARTPALLDKFDKAMDEATALVVQARGSFDKVDAVLENAKVATATLRSSLAENRPKIDRAMTNVKRAAEHLEAGLAEIRAAPWRLLNEPDDIDEHNLVVYAAARELASGAADLEATAATLEALSSDPNADPERLAQLREDLIRKYKDLADTQDEIWAEYRSRGQGRNRSNR